jgi:hypothetical protein
MVHVATSLMMLHCQFQGVWHRLLFLVHCFYNKLPPWHMFFKRPETQAMLYRSAIACLWLLMNAFWLSWKFISLCRSYFISFTPWVLKFTDSVANHITVQLFTIDNSSVNLLDYTLYIDALIFLFHMHTLFTYSFVYLTSKGSLNHVPR